MTQWFQKRPVAVQAIQWTGENTEEVLDFCPIAWEHKGWSGEPCLTIEANSGPLYAGHGYWIVKEKDDYAAYTASGFHSHYGDLELVR